MKRSALPSLRDGASLVNPAAVICSGVNSMPSGLGVNASSWAAVRTAVCQSTEFFWIRTCRWPQLGLDDYEFVAEAVLERRVPGVLVVVP
jgi:deoxycytidylate deaminase